MAMSKTWLMGLVGAGVVVAGLTTGGVFAFFTSQATSPQGVQVGASGFDLTVNSTGTLPLQAVGFFPGASTQQTFPVTLNATSALQGQIKMSVASVLPTTAGFAGVLKVQIQVNGVTVYGPNKTLQEFQSESPVILSTTNGGDTINVTIRINWPDGDAVVDNLHRNAQYAADVTILAEQVVTP